MKNADLFNPPLSQVQGEIVHFSPLHGASLSLALSSAMQKSPHPLLIIAPDPLFASRLIDELQFFNNQTDALIHFPDWETLPYDHFSPHQDIISERLKALFHLPSMQKGAILTTFSTLMHRLPPKDYLTCHHFLLKKGDLLNIDILRTQLSQAGYHAVSQVREHGEFAVRGSIVDLFPMGSETPFRIDLLDNEVDSIRIFLPDTQRSTEKIDAINLLPAKEFPLTS